MLPPPERSQKISGWELVLKLRDHLLKEVASEISESFFAKVTPEANCERFARARPGLGWLVGCIHCTKYQNDTSYALLPYTEEQISLSLLILHQVIQ